jgi:hypothetical protein
MAPVELRLVSVASSEMSGSMNEEHFERGFFEDWIFNSRRQMGISETYRIYRPVLSSKFLA